MNILDLLTEMETVAQEAHPDDTIQGMCLVWVNGMSAPLLGFIEKADGVIVTMTEVDRRHYRNNRTVRRGDFPWHIRTEHIFAARYADREDI